MPPCSGTAPPERPVPAPRATPTITPAILQALAPILDTDPPPTPNADAFTEATFLNTAAQLATGYNTALPGLQAQMELVNANPLIMVDGQWARQTQTLLGTLRGLNMSARQLIAPARYGGVWGEMLVAVEALDLALTELEQGLGQLDGILLNAYREDFRMALALYNQAAAQLQGFVPPALPTPVLSPTPIPRTLPG